MNEKKNRIKIMKRSYPIAGIIKVDEDTTITSSAAAVVTTASIAVQANVVHMNNIATNDNNNNSNNTNNDNTIIQKEDEEESKNNNNNNNVRNHTPTSSIVRIMLHTEDGIVPYITPDVFEHIFPSTMYSNIMCLGIAINETCVTPIYCHDSNNNNNNNNNNNSGDSSKKKQKKAHKNKISLDNHNDDTINNNNNNNNIPLHNNNNNNKKIHNTNKPRGYTFTSTGGGSYQLDQSGIQSYERIVVPTFDNNTNNNNNNNNTAKSISHHQQQPIQDIGERYSIPLRLWTSNGRQVITTKQYTDCAINAIQADYIVPLHYQYYPNDQNISIIKNTINTTPNTTTTTSTETKNSSNGTKSNNNIHQQVMHRIIQQNQSFIEEQHNEMVAYEHDYTTQQQHQQQGKNKLCYPFVVTAEMNYSECFNTYNPDNVDTEDSLINLDTLSEVKSVHHDHLLWILDQMTKSSLNPTIKSKNNNKDDNNLIMLVGWEAIIDKYQRWNILQSLHDTIVSSSSTFNNSNSNNNVTLGTLVTSSTQQIVQFIEYSILRNKNCHDDRCYHNPILIGTNLPTLWARKKCCFVLDFMIDKNSSNNAALKLDEDGCWDFNPPNDNETTTVQDHVLYSDTRPLMENCTCMTCTTYTRAYLFHLVCAQELLVEILFFIHNLHHLLQLLRIVNEYHANNDSDSIMNLCQSINEQTKRK